MKKPPILSRYPRSEPDRATWSFPHQIKLTFGRRSRRLHQYPACGGWGSKGRDHSSIRLFRPYGCAVRPPGSTRNDQVLEDLRVRSTSIIGRPASALPTPRLDATPRIRGLDEARTSGQDVFLRSGLRAVRQAFHNLNFFRRETLGLSCLACHVSRFATAPVLAGPNTSWEAG